MAAGPRRGQKNKEKNGKGKERDPPIEVKTTSYQSCKESNTEAEERRKRLEREKGRTRFTRPTNESAENIRNRMSGRRPPTSGRDSARQHATRDPRPIERDGELPTGRTQNPQGERDCQGGEEPTNPGDGEPKEVSKVSWSIPLERGAQRNESRLEEANRRDAEIIGESTYRGAGTDVEKGGEIPTHHRDVTTSRRAPSTGRQGGETNPKGAFLDCRPEMFFLPPTMGPDDSFEPPDWFLREVARISRRTTPTPVKPPIRFETSTEAARENANELKKLGYDLSRLIEENKRSTLNYGSEFRTVDELKPLLGKHPNFHELATVLSNGMPYIFTRELDPATKFDEMQTLIDRGNHKSAQENPEQVGILLGKDVHHGFVIPIPKEIIHLIPNAAVQPLGLVQQWTTKEDGSRSIKYRITQDLSYSSNREGPTRSINSRVDMGAYTEMIYGWCFPRILHYIVSMRTHQPDHGILISKYDYSDAYRRVAHSASAAAQTIAVNGQMGYIALRLTFGGSPNPPTWCTFSEIVTDLANEIGLCREWDPKELRSPAQPDTPIPVRLPKEIPIAKCRAMALLVPPTRGGKVDGFIDDLINVFLDTPENCARQPHVVPLAMHVTSRPHAGDDDEPVPRRPILSQPKLLAEGSPAEVQIVLGWRIDTRRLEVALPDDKFDAWMVDIETAKSGARIGRKELEQLLGRLNHTAYVLPISRHFLSRIREDLGTPSRSTTGNTYKANGKRSVKLSDESRADLALWESILRRARDGISMNLLVTRRPDKICWSDACPFGIGGYNLKGRAWRVRIPPDSPIHGQNGVNNLLEFMGMVINVWVSCTEPDSDQSCILSIGDNTSAIGWLHHTAHIDPGGATRKAHLLVARKLARLLMEHNCCLASQHVKGEMNVVADLLSFEGTGRGKKHPLAYDCPPNDVLTERFLKYLPSQVTADFVISQLPREISSWIMRVLRIVESSLTDNRKGATRASTGSGEDGKATATTSGTGETGTSINYPSTREDCSPRHSSAFIEDPIGMAVGNLQVIVRDQWCRTLYAKPLATWQRRFGSVSGGAPCTSKDQPTCCHQSGSSSKQGTTPTPRNPSREQSHQSSYELCSNGLGGGWPPGEPWG